jgi:hypothetical protein
MLDRRNPLSVLLSVPPGVQQYLLPRSQQQYTGQQSPSSGDHWLQHAASSMHASSRSPKSSGHPGVWECTAWTAAGGQLTHKPAGRQQATFPTICICITSSSHIVISLSKITDVVLSRSCRLLLGVCAPPVRSHVAHVAALAPATAPTCMHGHQVCCPPTSATVRLQCCCHGAAGPPAAQLGN